MQTARSANGATMKRVLKRCEQRAVAVGPNHSRQMVTHGAESTHKKKNVLRAPAGLGRRKDRDEKDRRADEEKQIPPTIQNPWG